MKEKSIFDAAWQLFPPELRLALFAAVCLAAVVAIVVVYLRVVGPLIDYAFAAVMYYAVFPVWERRSDEVRAEMAGVRAEGFDAFRRMLAERRRRC